MPTVADYSIILQGVAETPTGIDKDFTWTLPDTVDVGSRSIVTFTAYVEGGPAHFNIKINNAAVANYKLTDGWFGPLTFVVSKDILKKGSNKIRFALTLDDYAYVRVQQAVIWWQNKI